MRNLKITDPEEHSGRSLKRPNSELAQETAQVVTALMNAATSLHKLHLQVTGDGSFAQHLALNELYDVMHGHADTLAEGFQGASETLLKYENDEECNTNSENLTTNEQGMNTNKNANISNQLNNKQWKSERARAKTVPKLSIRNKKKKNKTKTKTKTKSKK